MCTQRERWHKGEFDITFGSNKNSPDENQNMDLMDGLQNMFQLQEMKNRDLVYRVSNGNRGQIEHLWVVSLQLHGS